LARDPGLRPGVNVAGGGITNAAVAEAVGSTFVPVDEALGPAPSRA
jgi:alanine dehydrogenase